MLQIELLPCSRQIRRPPEIIAKVMNRPAGIGTASSQSIETRNARAKTVHITRHWALFCPGGQMISSWYPGKKFLADLLGLTMSGRRNTHRSPSQLTC